MIFSNAFTEFGLSNPRYVNTDKIGAMGGINIPSLPTYKLQLVFNTAVPKSSFAYTPPYNPFLFGTRAAPLNYIEVHLPAHANTSKFTNTQLFGGANYDDNTSPSIGRYYVSKKGYPWALDLPMGWKWPTERTDIVTAYPYFKACAESGGTSYQNWYLNPSPGYVYP